MCWWQVWDVGDRFRMLVTDLIHWENHQHNEKVLNIMILSPTSEISHHDKVTNITMSPTSLSPFTSRLGEKTTKQLNHSVLFIIGVFLSLWGINFTWNRGIWILFCIFACPCRLKIWILHVRYSWFNQRLRPVNSSSITKIKYKTLRHKFEMIFII